LRSNQIFNHAEFGRIPKEWEVVTLGEIITYEKGRKPKVLLDQRRKDTLPYLTAETLRTGSSTQWAIEDSECIKVNREDIILIWDGFYCGDSFSGFEGILSSTMIKIEPKNQNLHKRFLFYFLKACFTELNTKISGMYLKHVNKFIFECQKLPLPPLPEQKKIAEILSTVDQGIEKVDEAIEKTQKLKKGLMQELLTKGIGHKEFKETEIGRIPREWNMMKLGEIANVRYGLGQPPAIEANGIPMIRATNVKRGRIAREGLIFINPNAVPNSRDPFLRAGDILVVRSGAYTGDVALVTKEWEGAIAGYDLIVTPSGTIDSQFLTYYLLSPPVQKRHFVGLKVRSAQPHLNSSQVEETPIPLPPLSEQQKIAEILSSVDERLELLRKRKERLKRTKKGLMNDLLTGKKRVTSLISEEDFNEKA
jgi:type I restriction enzyme S subunit